MLPFEVIDAPPNRLGECPLWCGQTSLLWWVDVLDAGLWSHDPASGVSRRHTIEARRLGSIALREDGGLLLACDDGLYHYDPESGCQTFIMDPEPDRRGYRKNDGRVDSFGNFWVGTLREADYAPTGRIYRIEPDGGLTLAAKNLSIPNSLAFDPERNRLYYADTRAYTIWACDYDGAAMGQPRIFARTEAPARPDGSCVDADGFLWNAEYAGGRLIRYAPSGVIDRVVELPVSHPTCCCFGGPGLDRLFVTSAYLPLSDAQRQEEPLAGKVLVLAPGLKGRPEFCTAL